MFSFICRSYKTDLVDQSGGTVAISDGERGRGEAVRENQNTIVEKTSSGTLQHIRRFTDYSSK